MTLNRLTSALAAAGVTSTLLVACGGGGGGDPVAPTPPPIAASVKLKGVAAMGRAFEGAMVSVTDSTGKSASMATPVGADGEYVIDVTGLKAPLVITATGAVGDSSVTLRSVVATLPATGSVTINISPLTHALAAMLNKRNSDPADLTPADFADADISAKLDVLRAAIAHALVAAEVSDAATFNALTATIKPGTHKGVDALLEAVRVSLGSSGVELRDLASNATVVLTKDTAVADVSGDKGLPAPALDAPKVGVAVAAVAALEAALNKCFAVVPDDRATLAPDGLVDATKVPCNDLGGAFSDDYLNSSYSDREVYSALIKDAAMTGAKWRVEIDRFLKGADRNDYATLVMRYTRSDAVTGNRVDTARNFPVPQGNQFVGWHLSGNQRQFDAQVNVFLNRTLYTSAERPPNPQGVQPDQFNGNGSYESGIRLFFNPLRHTNVRAVRVTNDKPGGVLPALGVVLGRADTTLPNGCGRENRMVLANQTGDVNIGAVSFRSNDNYVLDRASVDAAKPISKLQWKAYTDHAAAPISAPVPAYTRYKFEVFFTGNNSATPDATFTAPHIATVPLAASGSAFKWAEFTADTLAYVKPGLAIDKPVVAWTLPNGALNPISTFGFSRVSNGTARTLPLASVAAAASSAILDNTSPPAGCAGGAALADLGTSGFGFRGVGTFVSDPAFVRHENLVLWVNYQ